MRGEKAKRADEVINRLRDRFLAASPLNLSRPGFIAHCERDLLFRLRHEPGLLETVVEKLRRAKH